MALSALRQELSAARGDKEKAQEVRDALKEYMNTNMDARVCLTKITDIVCRLASPHLSAMQSPAKGT